MLAPALTPCPDHSHATNPPEKTGLRMQRELGHSSTNVRVVVARPGRDAAGGDARTSYFTRQGNRRPTRKQALNEETRKQALNKETSIQRGNKHSTRKQALNEETSTQRGNKHSTRKQALNKETSNKETSTQQRLMSQSVDIKIIVCRIQILILKKNTTTKTSGPDRLFLREILAQAGAGVALVLGCWSCPWVPVSLSGCLFPC